MRLIVGVSGASGAMLGVELLKTLQLFDDCEVHLIVTKSAEVTLSVETGKSLEDVICLAAYYHPFDCMSAVIASGTFITDGMIICPCSMKTVAGIASGYSDNLLLRAADVCLKERRKVVLVPRETPLSNIHLRNLLAVSQEGCVVIPPVFTLYHHPETLQELMDAIVAKILMQFGLKHPHFRPWSGS